jgi:hypothetical protein
MTNLETVLIIYIILCNVWIIAFVNVRTITRDKLWFILLTIIFFPISTLFLNILIWLEKNRKEPRYE